MRHAASSVPGPSKSVGARQADESADVALCPRQARLRIDGELFVSWSTRKAALIAALVQRRRNALHGVEVIDAAAIVLLTRRRRRPVSSWRFFARARAAQARRVDEIIKEADAINQRVDAVVSPPRSSRTGDVITRGLLYLAISGTLPRRAAMPVRVTPAVVPTQTLRRAALCAARSLRCALESLKTLERQPHREDQHTQQRHRAGSSPGQPHHAPRTEGKGPAPIET